MKLRNSEKIILLIVALSFIVGYFVYPLMPVRVASHWNAAGEVNGYMSRFWGTFFLPVLLVGMFLLFYIIPKIDPKKENIEKFRKYFDYFIVFIFVFLLYLYGLTLFWNLGFRLDMVRWLVPAFAILFYMVGILVGKAEPNWSIGIRTPWTLSSARSWKNTHALAEKLYKSAAAIALIGIFIPAYGIWFILVPIIFYSLLLVAYSYIEYKKDNISIK